MTDLLETRTRQLEHDSQNAEFVKVETDEYDRASPAIVSASSGNNLKQLSASKTAKNRTHEEKAEKSSGDIIFAVKKEFHLVFFGVVLS
jgi:hypothetical protein